MKFNSQVATSRVQSERILALGLKKETADMSWSNVLNDGNREWMLIPLPIGAYTDTEVPAWSLNKLLSMLPDDAPKIYWILNGANITIEFEDGGSDFFPHKGDIYKGVIDCIEWLIKEGYFNKEYLV